MVPPRTRLLGMLTAASMLSVASAMAEPVAQPVGAAAAAESLDHYLGWYRLPPVDRKTREPVDRPGSLIPIFKRGETYYTVMKWVEVPLVASDTGLVWGYEQTSMRGTAFTFDPATGEYFLIHCDAQHAGNDEWYVWGERRRLHPADPPGWLPDFTADPPRSLRDKLGDYYFAWCPVLSIRITEEDGSYWSVERVRDDHGRWVDHGSRQEVCLSSNPLRFNHQAKPNPIRFNTDLRRYEVVAPRPQAPDDMRMPLLREDPLADWEWNHLDEAQKRDLTVGVPAW